MPESGEEIELKLALAPADLGRFLRLAVLKPYLVGQAPSVQLESRYYDNAGEALAAKGLALRVRKAGRRHIQTLKVPMADPGGLQHTHEYEAERPDFTPDLSAIPDGVLPADLATPAFQKELRAHFLTRFRRRAVHLVFEGNRIELALDSGVIEAAGQQEPICEAELELKDGDPASLYRLALLLHQAVPFHLEARTKAARGYALAKGERPQAVRAKAITLDGAMTTAEGFGQIARACLAQLLGNETVVLTDNAPEGVHQMRVGLRRLRAAVGLFKDFFEPGRLAAWREDLGWLQSSLGPLRDWDVFLTETLGPLREQMPKEAGLRELQRAAEDLRNKARVTAIEAIRDPRYSDLNLRLGQSLAAGDWLGPVARPGLPLSRFAKKALAERAGKLIKRGRERKKLDEEALHALRIEGKKLRYAIEFFQELYPAKATRNALEALTGLQDCLGAINDAAVGRGLLDALRSAMQSGKGKGTLKAVGARERAIGLVHGWQAQRITRDLKRFEKTWRRVKKTTEPWLNRS